MSKIGFYNTPAWLKAREAALIRDKWLCQRCMLERRLVRATTVHHVLHLKDRPDLALELSNLVSLCATCHNAEHPEKTARKRRKALPLGVTVYKL